MAEVRRLLASSLLLTLVGAGGAGKTRLALQVAADLIEEYRDGVWLVELAQVVDPASSRKPSPRRSASRTRPTSPAIATLEEYLKPRSLLLVLDNCEHLVTACATLAESLLWICPGLRILATSREALGVGGETTWRIPSLTAAGSTRARSRPDRSRIDPAGVRGRPPLPRSGRAVAPSFTLTSENAPAIAQICSAAGRHPARHRAGGSPGPVLTPEQIAARLDDRFRLLTGGSRTAAPRQQTLRALIDWSYDLLVRGRNGRCCVGSPSSPGVDAGGRRSGLRWARPRRGRDPGPAHPACGQVVGRRRDSPRFELAIACWRRCVSTVPRSSSTSGDEPRLRSHHLDWFLHLAERAASAWWGPDTAAWIERLDTDHDNLRSALTWALADGVAERMQAALRLVGALGHSGLLGITSPKADAGSSARSTPTQRHPPDVLRVSRPTRTKRRLRPQLRCTTSWGHIHESWR